jgi:protein-tyrosine phosphatase
VARFFRTKHVSLNGPHYLIFNVCGERTYHHNYFSGQVVELPNEKDDAPTLEYICKFVEMSDIWLRQSPENVLSIHDITGLTRTGVYAVCWLLYSGFAQATPGKTPVEDAKEWYNIRRLGLAKDESMTYSPSQLRFIDYFKAASDKGGYWIPGICLDKIIVWTVPDMKKSGGCSPWFLIHQEDKEIFDYSKHHQVSNVLRGREKIVFDCNLCQLRGDIKITFFDHQHDEMVDEKMFFTTFHTGFVQTSNLVVPFSEIDGASQDAKHEVYSPQFRIELIFSANMRSKGVFRQLEPPSEDVLDDSQESSARLRANLVTKPKSTLPTQVLGSKLKSLVSQEKRRFQEDGFDLDLSYITKNLIAMGMPSTGAVGIYRNPADEVARFFNVRHPNKYMIYNLACETEIDAEVFGGRVNASFGFYDHQPPPMTLMINYCKDVHTFLSTNSKNVIGVHCLGGKGRSGMLD